MAFITVNDLVKEKIYNGLRVFEHAGEIGVPQLQSLFCSLSDRRMEYPARGINCQHTTCVELVDFIRHAEQSRKWVCPVCLEPVPYHQLYVDLTLRQILSKLKSKGDLTTRRVEVWDDGTWKAEELSTAKAKFIGLEVSVYRITPVVSIERRMQITMIEELARTSQPSMLFAFQWNEANVLAFDIEHSQWVAISGSDNKLKDFTGFNLEYYGNDQVFLIGGIDSNLRHSNSTFSFSLKRGMQKHASMKMPRSHFASCLLNNKLYVMGGQTSGESINHGEVYDILDNYWQDISPMPISLSCSVAVARTLSQIIVLGGLDFAPNRRIYSYSVTDNAWNQLSTLMPVALSRPLLFVNSDLAFIFGGTKNAGSASVPATDVLVLKLSTMQFRQEIEQLPTPIDEFPYKSLYDPQEGKVHIVSGGSSSVHIIFDITRELSQRPYGENASSRLVMSNLLLA
mmetsp:Transcript_28854/g.51410  ORF Transcript_28854/g.51410 Transcript_28854/m.51410 type:complete len:455 (-) Transcript_28854:240-1604(-)